MIDIQTKGFRELESELLQLEKKISKNIVRKGLRKAQNELKSVIKSYLSAIPSRGSGMTKKIASALQLKVGKTNKGSYAINVRIRPTPEFVHTSKEGRRTYIPSAIEYGHGKSKEQAARPFMRPAGDATEIKRMKILSEEIAIEIGKIWGKK